MTEHCSQAILQTRHVGKFGKVRSLRRFDCFVLTSGERLYLNHSPNQTFILTNSFPQVAGKSEVKTRLDKFWQMSVLNVRDFVKTQAETKYAPRYAPPLLMVGRAVHNTDSAV